MDHTDTHTCVGNSPAISFKSSFSSVLVTVTGMENWESGMEYLLKKKKKKKDQKMSTLHNNVTLIMLPVILRCEMNFNMSTIGHLHAQVKPRGCRLFTFTAHEQTAITPPTSNIL